MDFNQNQESAKSQSLIHHLEIMAKKWHLSAQDFKKMQIYP